MVEFVLERANYWAIIGLMMVGLYITFAARNMIKRLVGLSLFQTSVFLFYVTLAVVAGGSAPILYGKDYPKSEYASEDHSGTIGEEVSQVSPKTKSELKELYSNPLPHVLILTAIVVGVATLAAGLAIIVRLREEYGTIETDEVLALDEEAARAESEAYAQEAQA